MILIGALLSVAGGVALFFIFLRGGLEQQADILMMQGAGELVTAHLRLHDNRWPSNWSDLDQTYLELVSESSILRTNHGRIWNSKDLKPMYAPAKIMKRVEVDWSVTSERLMSLKATNSMPPVRLIWVKSGHDVSMQATNPNVMVVEYIRSLDSKATNR